MFHVPNNFYFIISYQQNNTKKLQCFVTGEV